MATSGNFTTTSSHNRSLTFSWNISSQSVAENYSTINWELKGSGTGTGYIISGNFKVVINGSTVYTSATRINLYNGTKVASGTAKIYHNSDGTKTFSASAEAGIYDYAVNCSGIGSWALTDIPRQAMIISAPDFTDEQNPTITYTNSVGDNVTSLRACISFTGATDDIAYRDISKTGNSYTFNLTTAERNILRNSIPNAKSRTVKFYISTVIGGNTYYSIVDRTLTIVNGNPTFSESNVYYADTNSTVVAITGNNQKIVQNKSSLIVIYTMATALKGATISSYEFVLNGVTRTSTSAGGTVSFGAVDSSNNLTLTVKVTDTRGFTTLVTKTITMVAYSSPTAIVTLERVNNYESTTLLKVDGTVSSVDNCNIMTIRYKYKEVDGSYNSLTTILDNSQYTLNCDKNKAFIFYIVVKDSFGTTFENEYTLSKGKFPFFIDANKNAVGVNEFPQSGEALRVSGGNANFLNGIQFNGIDVVDFVVEQGTSGIWIYRKWQSGKAECWGKYTETVSSISNAWGSLFTNNTISSQQTYPFEFVSIPTESVTAKTNNLAIWLYTEAYTNSTTKTARYSIARPIAYTGSTTITIDYYIVGKWK